MQKTVLKNAKRFLVILYLVAIVPIVAYFGKDIGETVFDKVFSTSDEIYIHYGCSWGAFVHHDEWAILQTLKGEDQIIDIEPFNSWQIGINEDNREQILDDFLNVRICKLTLECIAVLLVMGLAFFGMSYRGFYIPAWGIVLGIEMFLAHIGASWVLIWTRYFGEDYWSLLGVPFEPEYVLGIIDGIILFILLNVADWIRIKSGFNFRFTFLRITGCFVIGYGMTLFCFFYPLRYTEDIFEITILIPALFTSLLLVFVLRMVQLVIRMVKLRLRRRHT